MSALITVLYFDSSSQKEKARGLSRDFRSHEDEQHLCCAQCRQRIVPLSSAMKVHGSHFHRCRNPYGQQFDFRCYAVAPGCDVSGEPTLEHSWFSGYRWQYASCRQCQRHLGWFFNGESGFFGLIHGKLVPCI